MVSIQSFLINECMETIGKCEQHAWPKVQCLDRDLDCIWIPKLWTMNISSSNECVVIPSDLSHPGSHTTEWFTVNTLSTLMHVDAVRAMLLDEDFRLSSMPGEMVSVKIDQNW